MTRRWLAVVLAVVGAAAVVVPSVPAAARATAADDAIQLTVTGIDHYVPAPTSKLTPLTIRLVLTNNSSVAYSHVRILAGRGFPVSTQDGLDKDLASSGPPAGSSPLSIAATHPVTVDIPAGPGATVTDVKFTTTVSTSTDAGLCSCAQAAQPLIYPIYLSAHVTGPGGVDQRLGVTTTYLPSFNTKPAPLRVSWLWPLIDRPHRLADNAVFTDDDLASSVSAGGRLYNALDVVNQVGTANIPLTVVIDPELLDELQVMSTGKYSVVTNGHQLPGAGQAEAASWLGRLRSILAADPSLQVELTPYADPDITSLQQHGLHWSATMPAAMKARVATALGGQLPDTTVAWPAAGAIDQTTLQDLAKNGIGTVVLDESAVTPAPQPDNGLARLSAGHDIAAALTSPAIDGYAAKAIAANSSNVGPLPQLVAELAVRVAEQPTAENVLTIAAPRDVNADPDQTAKVIELTSSSLFSQPISLADAVSGSLVPVGRSKLARVPAHVAGLPSNALDAAQLFAERIPLLTSLLDTQGDPAASAFLAQLPATAQRIESSAWRLQPAAAGLFARQATALIHNTVTGVHIVQPSSGSYTLASDNSPLPITVENPLPYGVRVRISVSTVINAPGFSTKDVGVENVDSNQKKTINLPTSIQRSGQFQITAELLTPSGIPLGDPVELTVHSTALGVVGLVITIVAGVVLVLALLVRLFGRLRKRRTPEPLAA